MFPFFISIISCSKKSVAVLYENNGAYFSLFSSPGSNVHYLKGFHDRAEPWSNIKELEMLFIHNGKDNTVASMSVIYF